MARHPRSLPEAPDGASAVEFALVGPLLIMLLIGMAEFARVVTTDVLLEGAARDASRYGVTGSVANGQALQEADREAQIKAIISKETAGLVDMTKLTLSIKAYDDFSNVNTAGAGTTGAGGADDVVVYTLTYNQPLITKVFAGVLNSNTVQHTARVVVRNEPYDDSP